MKQMALLKQVIAEYITKLKIRNNQRFYSWNTLLLMVKIVSTQ